MKKKTLCLLATACILIGGSAFAQLGGVNLGSSTQAAARVSANTSSVNNAVNRTTTVAGNVTGRTINKANQLKTSSVNKVDNTKPEAKAHVSSDNTVQSGSSTTNQSASNNTEVKSTNSADVSISTAKTAHAAKETKDELKNDGSRTANAAKKQTANGVNKAKNTKAEVNAKASASGSVNAAKQ